MNVVSSMTGLGGGAAGTGFAAPSSTQVVSPATKEQADQLYGQVQTGIQNQADFLKAIQAQNGLQNQSAVFNQLQGVANGTGPNPALAQLNQSTGQNVANQTAMMAGQRGSSANPALMARQAANVGANVQQQAAGQAASLEANQALAALNQMGSLANQQAAQQAAATGAYTGATQGAQSNVLNSITGQNQANVGMQSNMNTANAGLVGTRMGQQGNIIGNIMGGAGAAMGLAEGGEVHAYADGGPIQPAQPSVSGHRSKVGQAMFGNQSQEPAKQPDALSQGANKMGQAIGTGMKKGWNSMFTPAQTPAQVSVQDQNAQMMEANRPDMMEGTPMTGGMDESPSLDSDVMMGAEGGIMDMAKKLAPMLMMAAEGGQVPALLSPGERYLSPEKVKKVAAGADPIKEGKKVPGKPKVGGAKNDYANDTVKATLEEGGIVLPRSVTQSKHPHWAAHKFVMEIMAKKGLKPQLPAKKK